MTFKAGTTGVFYLGGTANALVNLQPYADNVQVPQTVTMLDVSVLGTLAKSFITGLTDGDQITISGPLDPVLWNQLQNVRTQQTAAGSNAVPYIWGPMGSVATYPRSAGSVWVGPISTTSAVGGRVEYSASLQVTGSVTNSTF